MVKNRTAVDKNDQLTAGTNEAMIRLLLSNLPPQYVVFLKKKEKEKRVEWSSLSPSFFDGIPDFNPAH